MGRLYTGNDVFDAAIGRLVELYEDGHRLVCSFSAGKDSGVCLELMVIAATMTGKLPVEVVMRDEEIMFPGTFEYAERCAAREEVKFDWLIAQQPIINVFNREQPYWWVFDDLAKDQWVRQPPDFAEWIPDKNIQAISSPKRYPAPEGKWLVAVTGLRTQESMARAYSIHSSRGHLAGGPAGGSHRVSRPIYDWTDSDVWKFVYDQGLDYNRAYDTMLRYKVGRKRMRIGPPTMNAASAQTLRMAQQAWPQWFDRMATRCPGVRTVAQFGLRVVEPSRHPGEAWRDTFQRECIDRAPEWIAHRAGIIRDKVVATHRRHAAFPLPDVTTCVSCVSEIGSWRNMTRAMYGGDPFAIKAHNLHKPVEPEEFRPGAGVWGGAPSW